MSAAAPGRGAFRAILWKEFREGLLWGTVALLINGAGMLYLLTVFFSGGDASMYGPRSIVDVYPASRFAGVFAGVLIGLAQILPESRGTRWDFLAHRPRSRTTLFVGKACIGTLFYVCAYGIPIAAAIAWAATPGNLPIPFDARMIGPAVVDGVCGLIFYFAALLVGMRDAKWYGTRLLGFGSACLCFAEVTRTGLLSHALEWCAAGLAVVVIAAWGAFIAGGRYASQPLVAKIATAFSIAAAWSVVCGFVVGAIARAIPNRTVAPLQNDYKVLKVLGDGSFIQVVRDPNQGDAVDSVNDLQGRPDPRFANAASRGEGLWYPHGVISGSLTLFPGAMAIQPDEDYRGTSAICQRLSKVDEGTNTYEIPNRRTYWYYVHRLNLIAAYAPQVGKDPPVQFLGWLGPAGFSEGPAIPPTRFPGPLLSSNNTSMGTSGPLGMDIFTNTYDNPLIAFASGVYHLDLSDHRVDKIFTPAPGDTVLSATAVAAPNQADSALAQLKAEGLVGPNSAATAVANRHSGSFDAIATSKSVYVLSPGARPMIIPRDSATCFHCGELESSGYGSVEVSRPLEAPGVPIVLHYSITDGWFAFGGVSMDTLPDRVMEFDTSGAAVARFVFPRRSRELTHTTAWGRLAVTALTMPVTSWMWSWGGTRMMEHLEVGLKNAFMKNKEIMEEAPLPWSQETTVRLILMLLASLGSAGATYLRGRRYAFTNRRLWLWTWVAFASGLIGYLLMLAVLEWPRLETCPSCRRARVVERDRCEYCGAVFALPEPGGVEVFGGAPRVANTGAARHPIGRTLKSPPSMRHRLGEWLGLAGTTPPIGLFAAILWKELREGLVWGAIGFAIVGFTVGHTLQIFSGGPPAWQRDNSIMDYYQPMAFAGALVAMLIGFAQMIRERRGDRWGFLTHRPVSRTTLFLAKASAGILLYAAAYAIPVAVGIVWAATPGHLAVPFDARMALPAAADLACGVVFYLAALVIAMRDARWFGSRALAVGAALLCMERVMSVRSFWVALAICALGVAVVGAAAWGTFLAGGDSESAPRWSRAGVGLSIGTGMIAVTGLPLLVILNYVPPKHYTPPKNEGSPIREYELASDATIVQIVRKSYYAFTTIIGINDVQGHPLARNLDSVGKAMLEEPPCCGIIEGSVALRPGVKPEARGTYRMTIPIFTPLMVPDEPGDSPNVWYYIHRDRLVALYNKQTARLVGWLGPSGFTEGPTAPRARFPGQEQGLTEGTSWTDGPLRIMTRDFDIDEQRSLLSFSSAVYRLDLQHRRVEKIFTPPAGDSVLTATPVALNPFTVQALETLVGQRAPNPLSGADELSGALTPLGAPSRAQAIQLLGPQSHFVVVATTTRVYVVGDGMAPLVVPYDAAAAADARVSRTLLAPGTPTFVWLSPPAAKVGGVPRLVVELDTTGAVAARFSLPHTPSPPRGGPNWDPPSWGALGTLQVPQQIMYDLIYRLPILGWAINPPLIGPPIRFALHPERRDLILQWALVALSALVFGGLAYGNGRRHAFGSGRLWLWTGVGAALGLFGLLLMVALVDGVARERCRECGKPRVVTRDRCEHCGAPFGRPRRDGTEIFGREGAARAPA